MIRIDQKGGQVHVTGPTSYVGSYASVEVHGCDVVVPGRGALAVYGSESTWTDDYEILHISDDKRVRPSDFGVSI